MRRKSIWITMLLLVSLLAGPLAAFAASGPNFNGNETINNSRLTSQEDMAAMLMDFDKKSPLIEVEVIGQPVRGRDLFLVKFGNYDPAKPTVLYLTQQHGNEVLATEAALEVIKKLSTNARKVRELAEKVNVFFVPRINPDGAAGDVNYDISHYYGGGLAARTNYNGVDLNRDHEPHLRTQPETQALHYNVLQKYKIDYMIDLHHQGTRSSINGELVSGSMLYPTNPTVDPQVILNSMRFASVAYHAVEDRGWRLVGKYNGGTGANIARNGLAMEYGIATLLFEMRGMIDHQTFSAVLGQKSNGKLIQQSIVVMEATMEAVADGSVHEADISFWETLPFQRNLPR